MPHSPLDMTPIRLSDGWSGHVAVKDFGRPSSATLPSRLPTIEQWYAQLDRLATDPSRLPGYEVLKYGKGGTVFRARLEASGDYLDVVVKRTRPRGLIRRLAAGLGCSRARRNFIRAMTLLDASVNTALPLAVIGRARPHPEALLITVYVHGLADLDDILLRRLPSLPGRGAWRVKYGLIERIVDLLVRLEQLGLTHRDFKASNVLVEGFGGWASSTGIADADRRLNVWLVDLDGLSRCRWRRSPRRWRPIICLAASLLGHSAVTRTDYARFLRCYLARGDAPRQGWRRRYRRLAERAVRYARRASRRKIHKLDGFTTDG